MVYVEGFWIVVLIGVMKSAMMVIVLPVARRVFTSVNVGRLSWKENVVKEFLGVEIHVKSCLDVESILVGEGVTKVNVGSVRCRGIGPVPVVRKSMKEWLVMLLFLSVDPHVTSF